MNLDEAIQQLINLGEKDPLTIARKLLERHPQEVSEELAKRAEEIIASYARNALGTIRRSAEVSLQTGEPMATAELKLKSYWVPGTGYKVAADLSAEDLRERAHWYDLLSAASAQRASWCREVATLMEVDGVVRLGDLKRDLLPPLPPLELEAVA